MDAPTPNPAELADVTRRAVADLVGQLRQQDTDSLNRELQTARDSIRAAIAAAETELLARVSTSLDGEIAGLVDGLMPAIEGRVQVSVQHVQAELLEERAQAEALRRELHAEKDRADAARAARKQSELAFREAEAALKQTAAERARLEEEVQQVKASTSVYEDAIDELRGEHAAAMKEQAITSSSLPLDQLLNLFKALSMSGTVADALTTLVNGLALEFSRVALFSVHDTRLEGVRQVGFDLNTDFSKVAVSLSGDSLLGRAFTSKRIETWVHGVDGEHSGAPFGGTPECALALPIVVRGETLAVIYADDSDHVDAVAGSPQLRTKFADLLLQHVVLILIKISAEQHTRAELREYARTLLEEMKYGYVADVGAGKSVPDLHRRLIDNLECSRRIFAQRSTQEGPDALALFDEQLAALIEEAASTPFGRDLAQVAGRPSPASAEHLAS